MTDQEIVKEIQAGNQELYSEIMERYQDKLLRYIANLIKDNQKAVDIVQDTFIKTFVNLKSFDVERSFSSWIYRIAHNEAINFVKKYQKEIALPEDFDMKSDEDIFEDIEKREMVEQVSKCLDKMPFKYSEPLTLFYIENKSYQEISDILRISMGTVATHISRAKILMRKICQKK